MGNFTSKMTKLNQQVRNCYTDLEDLIKELTNFEQKYDIPSESFFRKFSQGELEHKTDFFEWYAYVDMCRQLIQKIRSIERKIGDELEQELLEYA
ncbi:hypothetical protein L0Z72_05620 [candidate division KSB1 bacterium]|jgi:hypothetical protein|nr:hypothetical protein [candidate division KSB1 bacterium]